MALIELAAILLLPAIPAYLLYAVLPSGADVSGPFKGLNIKLSGAFGGYFLLVLLSSGYVAVDLRGQITGLEDQIAELETKMAGVKRYEIWTIKGSIEPRGLPETRSKVDQELFEVVLWPGNVTKRKPNRENVFEFVVKAPFSMTRGQLDLDFDDITVNHDEYFGSNPVKLKDHILNRKGRSVQEKLQIDYAGKTIRITEPIVIQYDAAASQEVEIANQEVALERE